MDVPFLTALLTPAKERVVLDDGRPVTIVPIGPDAKPLIAAAIGRVSPETSRRRFFTVRRRFSERELDELTALDGWHRYAIGAVGRGPEGPLGAAVARFARLPDDPSAAEFAMIVVDDYQHVGLGRRLLARLSLAARLRGIARLVGRVLPDNDAMINLLQRHAPGVAIEPSGDHYAVEVPLSGGWFRTLLAAA